MVGRTRLPGRFPSVDWRAKANSVHNGQAFVKTGLLRVIDLVHKGRRQKMTMGMRPWETEQ